MVTYLIKLGGSVVTRPSGKLDIDNVLEIGKRILEAKRSTIIVHGSGVKIKTTLQKVGLETDFLGKDKRDLASRLNSHLDRLNSEITRAFIGLEINAASIAGHQYLSSEDGRIITNTQFLGKVNKLLTENKVPVVSGGVIVDDPNGFYFPSTDEIVSCLAVEFRPKVVLFLTDVDGVYENYNDKTGGGNLLRTIRPSQLKEDLSYRVGHPEIYDKVKQALICAKVAEVIVLNGRNPENLSKAMGGQDYVGTRIIL